MYSGNRDDPPAISSERGYNVSLRASEDDMVCDQPVKGLIHALDGVNLSFNHADQEAQMYWANAGLMQC